MKPTKYIVIDEMPLNPYPVTFSLVADQTTMMRIDAGLKGGADFAGFATGRTLTYPHEFHIVVGVFDKSRGTLVHELTHAVQRLFELIHAPINGETSEPHAYMMGWLYERCERALRAAKIRMRP
jgi:hypothetical protein